MVETIIGVILGGLLSWLTSHWYYKKQERSNPAPVIREIKDKVQEIYDLSVVRNNKELQRKLKDLMALIGITYNRIGNLIVPLSIDSQGLNEVYESGDIQRFESYLKEVLPGLLKFHENVAGVLSELDNLKAKFESLNPSQ